MKKSLFFIPVLFFFKTFSQTVIQMKREGGVSIVPCKVNGLQLSFIFDTGASDVTISLTEALFMLKNDYLKDYDITGRKKYYSNANGELSEGEVINLREIEIQGLKLYNIKASIVKELNAPLLLGQTAISKLGVLQLDLNTNTLTILNKKGSSEVNNVNEINDESNYFKYSTNIGDMLPNFYQENQFGQFVYLSSFRGKYVLVDFWASWCGPCRGENPNVVSAFKKYSYKNFTVLGVSLDKSKDPWIQAINNDGLTWTHVSDLKGWNNVVAQKFGINSIPQNFLIDPNGVIIGKNLRGPDLEAKLERIFK